MREEIRALQQRLQLTVAYVTHDQSEALAVSDQIIVMDAGRIVERGSHAELLARNGIYARLWAHQSGGFLGLED